jgi:hypothetical protein
MEDLVEFLHLIIQVQRKVLVAAAVLLVLVLMEQLLLVEMVVLEF